jgi:hypothetical protein
LISRHVWWAVIVTVCYGALVAPTFRPAGDNPTAVAVYAGRELVARRALPAAREHMAVPGPLGVTAVEIEGARVRIVESPCPGKVCIARGWLEHAGDAAICLPNKVAVYVE